MEQNFETVHVAWGSSRAESVRGALRLQGNGERVVALFGVLNVGPINPPDPDARNAWFGDNLQGHPSEYQADGGTSWQTVTSNDVQVVYWVCRTDAGEHACFLEFVSRMAGRPFEIVDATGLELTTATGMKPIRSLGALRPVEIVSLGLAERRCPFTGAESDAAIADWSRLKEEDAPLRIVRDGRLISAPLTQFDGALADQAAPDWEVAAKLIGRVLHFLSSEASPPEQGANDEVLFARILALAEEGILERAGDGPGMRDYQIRRPASSV